MFIHSNLPKKYQFENIIDEDEIFEYLYERFGTKYQI